MDQLPWLGDRELFFLLLFTCNYVVSVRGGGGGLPLPLGAWDGLRYFIVALPETSIKLFLIAVVLSIIILF